MAVRSIKERDEEAENDRERERELPLSYFSLSSLLELTL